MNKAEKYLTHIREADQMNRNIAETKRKCRQTVAWCAVGAATAAFSCFLLLREGEWIWGILAGLLIAGFAFLNALAHDIRDRQIRDSLEHRQLALNKAFAISHRKSTFE